VLSRLLVSEGMCYTKGTCVGTKRSCSSLFTNVSCAAVDTLLRQVRLPALDRACLLSAVVMKRFESAAVLRGAGRPSCTSS
jgi:hypothetical protein